MNLLPRLLYLFQMLPVGIPKSMFVELDKIISKFIWQSKRPRIKYKTLQRSKTEGGLNLPVLKYYFWAAQLKPLISWIQQDSQTRWLSIEQAKCSVPLKVLPFLDILVKDLPLWTKTTLNIWNKVRISFKLPRGLSILTSIGHIKSFTPNFLDKKFSKWAEQGLTFLHQLIDRNNLMSFEELCRNFHLQKNDFFRYLQLRSFLSAHRDWERKGGGDKKLITKLYSVFLSMNFNEPTWTKQRWEAETAKKISDETWEEVWTEAHRVTNSNTWREYKWKIISRYFRTPDVVSKMDPKVPSLCWRNCGSAVPNHTHIFWSCPKLQNFWDEVYRAINQIFPEVIPKDVTVALLGIIPDDLP
uniref:Reverse transcriptase zinc-binding domain-containing protein n=1 Tax=Xiphophorus maculatus TaxID=8083 RepID=A0A3B5QTR8_XIPMA